MCESHDSNCNGFGDIWWTDKLFYFSSIDQWSEAQVHYGSQTHHAQAFQRLNFDISKGITSSTFFGNFARKIKIKSVLVYA